RARRFGPSPERGDHHGRERAVGGGPRPFGCRRAPRRCTCAQADGRGGHRSGRRVARRVRLLDRELGPSRGGGRGSARAARRDDRTRASRSREAGGAYATLRSQGPQTVTIPLVIANVTNSVALWTPSFVMMR